MQNRMFEIAILVCFATKPLLCSGSLRIVTANNDCQVRVFDAENFASLGCFKYDWSVNVSVLI